MFSFVEFETGADLKTAVEKLDGQEFKGATVHCVADVCLAVKVSIDADFDRFKMSETSDSIDKDHPCEDDRMDHHLTTITVDEDLHHQEAIAPEHIVSAHPVLLEDHHMMITMTVGILDDHHHAIIHILHRDITKIHTLVHHHQLVMIHIEVILMQDQEVLHLEHMEVMAVEELRIENMTDHIR